MNATALAMIEQRTCHGHPHDSFPIEWYSKVDLDSFQVVLLHCCIGLLRYRPKIANFDGTDVSAVSACREPRGIKACEHKGEAERGRQGGIWARLSAP